MIGVIIVNYNGYNSTCECIESIETVPNEEILITIVDNGSEDGSVEKFTTAYGKRNDIEILKTMKNNGYSGAINFCLKHSRIRKCDYVIISNNDVIFTKSAIVELREEISKKRYDIIGPKILLLSGEQQTPGFGRLGLHELIYQYTPLKYFKIRSENKYLKEFSNDIETINVAMTSGCCFMISKNALGKIGYFDEKVFLYFEEAILAKKLKEMNLKAGCTPKAIIFHKHQESTQKNPIKSYSIFKSSLIYYARNYLKLSAITIFLLKLLLNIQLIIYYRKILYKKMISQFTLLTSKCFR